MADHSKIEWTEATWNPVTGCTKVSPGCDHPYENGFDVTLRPERLDQPLRWKRGRRIFVNSMSDLFHADVPDDYIARVFAVMAMAGQHTFQVLTKRHARMRSLLSDPDWEFQFQVGAWRHRFGDTDTTVPAPSWGWPLPNVWLGVSVEDQHWADIRVPALLDTPAAVRFLSCEPLLGPIDLAPWLRAMVASCGQDDDGDGPCVLKPDHFGPCYGPDDVAADWEPVSYASLIDWVIVGGESGPGARPMNLAWAESLVKQCQNAGAAVHVKQLGSVWAKGLRDSKGGNWDLWPHSLRVREYPDDPGRAG